MTICFLLRSWDINRMQLIVYQRMSYAPGIAKIIFIHFVFMGAGYICGIDDEAIDMEVVEGPPDPKAKLAALVSTPVISIGKIGGEKMMKSLGRRGLMDVTDVNAVRNTAAFQLCL